MLSGLRRNIRIARELSRERGFPYVMHYVAAGYMLEIRLESLKWTRLAGAWLLHQPLIHVIGDSHTWALANCRGTIIHNIGPATAYNLANPGSSGRYGIKLCEVVSRIDPKRDYVLLVFGEIDCRVHIYNHYMKSGRSITISHLIDQTIKNYGEVLRLLESMDIRFGVCSIVPATGHIIRYPIYATATMRQRLYEEFTQRYPYQATPEIASAINREFNAKMKQYCLEHGYPYCDIYTIIADEGGFMKEEYRKDEIHANGRTGVLVSHWLAGELSARYQRSADGQDARQA